MNIKLEESQTLEKFRNGTKMSVKPIFAFVGELEDEPINLIIIPSGWLDQFHVIVEFGDSDTSDIHFMNREQILARFEVEVPDMNLRDMARKEGNDMSFGKSIRSSIL